MPKIMMAIIIALVGLTFARAADAAVPFFNASCPGKIEVHVDEGGPIYVDGKEARLRRFNENYY